MRLDGQLFGLPVEVVQDVLLPHKITRVPMSTPEVAGLINLRGRIVTVINMRAKLGLPEVNAENHMEIVIEVENELYSLVVDGVDEVLTLYSSEFEPTPPNLAPLWKCVSCGVYRMENELMVVLDVPSLFYISPSTSG